MCAPLLFLFFFFVFCLFSFRLIPLSACLLLCLAVSLYFLLFLCFSLLTYGSSTPLHIPFRHSRTAAAVHSTSPIPRPSSFFSRCRSHPAASTSQGPPPPPESHPRIAPLSIWPLFQAQLPQRPGSRSESGQPATLRMQPRTASTRPWKDASERLRAQAARASVRTTTMPSCRRSSRTRRLPRRLQRPPLQQSLTGMRHFTVTHPHPSRLRASPLCPDRPHPR